MIDNMRLYEQWLASKGLEDTEDRRNAFYAGFALGIEAWGKDERAWAALAAASDSRPLEDNQNNMETP